MIGLLYRQLSDDLNIHEQIELDNWLKDQDDDSRQFFEDLTDKEVVSAVIQMASFNEEAALLEVQARIAAF